MEHGIQCVTRISFHIQVRYKISKSWQKKILTKKFIVLTDTEFKSNAAYSFLKEL